MKEDMSLTKDEIEAARKIAISGGSDLLIKGDGPTVVLANVMIALSDLEKAKQKLLGAKSGILQSDTTAIKFSAHYAKSAYERLEGLHDLLYGKKNNEPL